MEEFSKKHILSDEDRFGIGNKLEEFEPLQYLGGGNSYHYSKVKSKLNNKIYVMKIITDINKDMYKDKERYLQFLRTLSHPYILKYYSSFLENNNYHIIMEYAENGNLKNFIKIHKILNQNIDEPKLNSIYYQSMLGLKYLHDLNIAHGNISISSLFLDKDGVVKLGGMDNLYVKKEKYFDNDISSLGKVFYHLRNLMPKYKILPNKHGSKYVNKNIDDDIKVDDSYPEYYMLEEFQLDKDKSYKIIEDNYEKIYNKCSNTSIESVFFCLRYICEHQYINMQGNEKYKIEKRKIKLNEIASQGPISKSFGITDLKKLRDNLNNKDFNKFGEIPPQELIKYLIKNLHIENNRNNKNKYSKIFNLSNDKNNRKYYLDAYSQYFDSVISNRNKGFFGTFHIENSCLECKNKNEYYESFYYITLDFDQRKEEKNTIIEEYLKKGCEDTINIYKHCPFCKKATKHIEKKSIYKYPCRLVILIKNNSKKSLKHSLSFSFQQKFNLCTITYNLVNTINYNEKTKKYEYSYYKIGNEKKWEHPFRNEEEQKINTKNVVALFYLYLSDDANFDDANIIQNTSNQNNYLFQNNKFI